MIPMGGPLPVAAIFKRELGVDTVFLGWGMPGNQIHAPNEWIRLADLNKAKRGHARYLLTLGR
jgi:acetylornithine deacetylase/succinyl-diaminopimelate desuccinylase-like protein